MNKPREYLVNPKDFGKRSNAPWVEGISPEEFAASNFQHRYCIEMRKQIKNKYGTLREYCKKTNQSYQRVGQILRGDVVLNSNDIGVASACLSLSMDFVNDDNAPLAANTSARDVVGAYYTPEEVSAHMVNRLHIDGSARILEPSFGDGSFLRAIANCGFDPNQITACEIDQAACRRALASGLIAEEGIHYGSFFNLDVGKFDAAIGNPPYVRLRALSADEKNQAINLSESILGSRVGEESSEWLPFLLKCVHLLDSHGSLALVLPFDFTYVKYARRAWEYLGKSFSKIEVLRSKERLFEDILQDVILLFAFGKGGSTEKVEYRCYETRSDLINESPSISSNVSIKEIVSGVRAFQKALVPVDVLEFIENSPFFVRAGEEADFHIGYVCGNKAYFHPNAEAIDKYSIPETSLVSSVVSSRQVAQAGFKTSALMVSEKLWLPPGELSEGEKSYVAFGEREKINLGYKCRTRKPWWRVPSVKVPQAIISVFGDAPRVLLNDSRITFSNSLLGAYIHEGIDETAFCLTWYSSLTLLSIELEIHSLGGGVLVAVPKETSRVLKIASRYFDCALESNIDSSMKSKNAVDAYLAGDALLSSMIGEEMTRRIIDAVGELKSWRIR